jgi:glycosyltransferase involved in cell wall biosynthesis
MYPCYLAYFLPKSIPVIITFWNGDVTWWAQWSGIERLLKKQLVIYGVRRAKAITVNSQEAFKTCLNYGAKAEKIHLIRYPGVDASRFKPIVKEEAKRKLGITAKKVVLCPRGLSQYLNSDIIVKAAATVAKRYPDSLFVFVSGVGGQNELRKHKEQAFELGIENYVRWDGQVPWELMPTYYNAADVMVSISSNDSLPNCMLEAMSCGTPIIMGDIPQIREWVADGVNGFLVPTRNPGSLSNRIADVFEGSVKMIASLTQSNVELVKREFDSERNGEHVKNLVHLVAGSFGNRIDQKTRL